MITFQIKYIFIIILYRDRWMPRLQDHTHPAVFACMCLFRWRTLNLVFWPLSSLADWPRPLFRSRSPVHMSEQTLMWCGGGGGSHVSFILSSAAQPPIHLEAILSPTQACVSAASQRMCASITWISALNSQPDISDQPWGETQRPGGFLIKRALWTHKISFSLGVHWSKDRNLTNKHW